MFLFCLQSHIHNLSSYTVLEGTWLNHQEKATKYHKDKQDYTKTAWTPPPPTVDYTKDLIKTLTDPFQAELNYSFLYTVKGDGEDLLLN